MGLWRFSLGNNFQGSFDLVASFLLITLGILGSTNHYFLIVSRFFAVLYTLATWMVIQFIGVNGLYWSYVATVAIFFVARRNEALLVAATTYSVSIYNVWGQTNELLFTYTACYLLISFFCYHFSNRLLADNSLLTHQATIDALTGVGNRRAFDNHITHLKSDSYKHKHDYTLIMFDIDHFKKINDNFGHQAGDRVLRRLAIQVAMHIGSKGNLYRYGGEEFVILTDLNLMDATSLAEDLRKIIEKNVFLREQSEDLTISLGVSHRFLNNDTDIHQWLKQVDDALYTAKTSGRNRVIVSEDIME